MACEGEDGLDVAFPLGVLAARRPPRAARWCGRVTLGHLRSPSSPPTAAFSSPPTAAFRPGPRAAAVLDAEGISGPVRLILSAPSHCGPATDEEMWVIADRLHDRPGYCLEPSTTVWPPPPCSASGS
jgi:hypothetical protein